jgi:hypothetical protein
MASASFRLRFLTRQGRTTVPSGEALRPSIQNDSALPQGRVSSAVIRLLTHRDLTGWLGRTGLEPGRLCICRACIIGVPFHFILLAARIWP